MTPTELAIMALRDWAADSGHDLLDLQAASARSKLLLDPVPYIAVVIDRAVRAAKASPNEHSGEDHG